MWLAGGMRREAHRGTHLDAVGTRVDEDARHSRAVEGVEIMWPLMPTLWEGALHTWGSPSTQSGQHSALAPMKVSKAGAHRA